MIVASGKLTDGITLGFIVKSCGLRAARHMCHREKVPGTQVLVFLLDIIYVPPT